MDWTCDFLFARPSVWEGIGRILDFGNTLNEYNNSSEPDEIALRLDWVCVGNNLRQALKIYGTKTEKASGLTIG